MTDAPNPTGGDETDALDTFVDSLRGFDEAYSTRFFREVSDEDGDWLHRDHPGLQDRIAADMGRHLATFLVQAADTIDALRAKVELLTTERDRARGEKDRWYGHAEARDKECNKLWKRATAAESLAAERAAEVGRLRAALEPFAENAPVTLSVVNERGCRFAAYYETEQPAFRDWIGAREALAASGGGDDA